jgi:hypothetical protein
MDNIYIYNKHDINEENKRIFYGNRTHKLILADKYCPIFAGEHEPESECYRSFVATDAGYAFMTCTNKKCVDKISPRTGIKLSKRQLKNIFPPLS